MSIFILAFYCVRPKKAGEADTRRTGQHEASAGDAWSNQPKWRKCHRSLCRFPQSTRTVAGVLRHSRDTDAGICNLRRLSSSERCKKSVLIPPNVRIRVRLGTRPNREYVAAHFRAPLASVPEGFLFREVDRGLDQRRCALPATQLKLQGSSRLGSPRCLESRLDHDAKSHSCRTSNDERYSRRIHRYHLHRGNQRKEPESVCKANIRMDTERCHCPGTRGVSG